MNSGDVPNSNDIVGRMRAIDELRELLDPTDDNIDFFTLKMDTIRTLRSAPARWGATEAEREALVMELIEASLKEAWVLGHLHGEQCDEAHHRHPGASSYVPT